ncbi:hypothetical protein Tsubulata_047311 [Turnera subulata]|uniref:Retrovirus-related Pol polyprotein from transposon TNT 1-94-like beta-barrel domain-containing protein n=1 Tax=Turnera subulata TaxID=218843 RepID=A0A9Q0F693_9ROSI|nr:hypothetical protein Tsubulata_047311 [Turnera subulata]
MESINGGNGSLAQYGMEKLVGINYKYWRMCMEVYLQGQDLWELVNGVDTEIPAHTQENSKPRRKWKIKFGKALFSLRTSISKELVDHIRNVDSPQRARLKLESLYTQKNTARMQLFVNELAMLTQGAHAFASYANNAKKEEWIMDSRCSHHVTGDDSSFSEMREHRGDRVIVTADNSTYPMVKEGVVKINVAGNTTRSVKLQDVFMFQV